MAIVEIAIDDLASPEIIELLQAHVSEMRRVTPQEESVHALDLDGLRRPEVTFWSLRDGDAIAGHLVGDARAVGRLRKAGTHSHAIFLVMKTLSGSGR